ncbi:hypothetical protein ABK040_015819 [Willaertia magna]
MFYITLSNPIWRAFSLISSLSIYIYYHIYFSKEYSYYEFIILLFKTGIVIHLHTIFIFLFDICKVILFYFIEDITKKEFETFSNEMIPYVTINTFFIFYILNEESIVKEQSYVNKILLWIIWLTIIGILKCFNIIIRERSLFLMDQYQPIQILKNDKFRKYKDKNVKLMYLLGIITFLNIFMIFGSIIKKDSISEDTFYYFLFIYENVVLFIENCKLLIKYGKFISDLLNILQNYNNIIITKIFSIIFHNETAYVTEFTLEILLLLFNCLHYLHIWYLNGLQFSVIDILLFILINNTFNQFKIQIKKLLSYKKITNCLDTDFPKPKEINQDNDICAICHELNDVEHSRVLECNHTYHLLCINQWMRSSFTCPFCRRDVLPPNNHVIFSTNDLLSTISNITGAAATTIGSNSRSSSFVSNASSNHTINSTIMDNQQQQVEENNNELDNNNNSGGSWFLPFSVEIHETTSDGEVSSDDDNSDKEEEE